MSKRQRNLRAVYSRECRRERSAHSNPPERRVGSIGIDPRANVVVGDFIKQGNREVRSRDVTRDANIIPFPDLMPVLEEDDEAAIGELAQTLTKQALSGAAEIPSDLGLPAVAYIALIEATGLFNEIDFDSGPTAA